MAEPIDGSFGRIGVAESEGMAVLTALPGFNEDDWDQAIGHLGAHGYYLTDSLPERVIEGVEFYQAGGPIYWRGDDPANLDGFPVVDATERFARVAMELRREIIVQVDGVLDGDAGTAEQIADALLAGPVGRRAYDFDVEREQHRICLDRLRVADETRQRVEGVCDRWEASTGPAKLVVQDVRAALAGGR